MDLLEHFQRHLKFIEASCVAYDQGDTYEALRIAVSLRVLFHDTAKHIITRAPRGENKYRTTINYRLWEKCRKYFRIFYFPSFNDEYGWSQTPSW